MKMNKLIFPMMIALVATMAFTGCKKGPTTITKLPGMNAAPTGDQTPSTMQGNQVDMGNGGGISATPTGTPLPTSWDPDKCRQDRNTLAEQTVHFAYDSAAIRAGEEAKVLIVAEHMKSDPSALLLIEGNCDERGTEEYNRSLGERRALALREDLIGKGVDANRIQTRSYGKDKPADPGHDEAAWSKNRRGEFVLCYAQAGM